MQNEILKPVLETDETAIPRYDIVNSDGSVTQQNVELRLKNQVIQEGTPYDEESVLPANLATQLGLTATATPAQALQCLATKSYSKDETISNATKTLFSLGASAVPDDAFVLLKTLVSDATELAKSKAQITTGTYTGTGDTKAKKTLTFPFAPKLLFISGNSTSYYSYLWVINFGGGSYGIAENSSNSKASLLSVTFSGSQVSWTPRDSVVGLDWSGYTYRYVAIG